MSYYPHHIIDWTLLAQAAQFYSQAGFSQKETPYALPELYHSYTKPHNDPSFILNRGMFSEYPHELVGSAEQGFIYLILNSLVSINDRLFSVTPCFRCDTYDNLHQPWFMKLELFHYSSKIEDLTSMIDMVKSFCAQHTTGSLKIVVTGDNMYDLELNDIEIASFGFREVEGLTFIYGTGLALPRFSIANNKDDNYQKDSI